MDGRTISRSLWRSSRVLACSAYLAFLLPHLSHAQAAPQSTKGQAAQPQAQISPAIPGFEQQLFFKTFDDDEIGMRVRRIERQIFGEAVDAPLPERVGRLETIFAERQAEKRKEAEQQAQANASAQAQANAQAAAQAAEAARRNEANARAAQPTADELQERRRLEVQSAREKEMADLLQEGVDLFRARRIELALSKFDQVLRLDPQNPDAHFSMGIALEARGNYQDALNHYQSALAARPDNGEYRDAIRAIEKKAAGQGRATATHDDQKKLADAAAAAFKRGEYIDALQLYQQLDQKSPNRALVKYNIATIYIMLKDQNAALKFYEDAYRLEGNNPRYAKAYKELSSELKRAGKEQAAVQKEAQKQWQEAAQPDEPKKQKKPRERKKKNEVVFSNPGRPGVFMMPGQQQQMMPGQPMQQPVQQDPLSALGFAGRFTGNGYLVGRVVAGSRAGTAGLAAGDEIKAVDGFEIYNEGEIYQLLGKRLNGPIQMMIMRAGMLAVVNM